ncbi:sensor histidine kinase [Nocardioides sp.]|uniref:sensor histidine kinase n=1 Tax=Nocardioides sp. TaxID=35761 RepID=UPI002ED8DA10
MDRREALRRSLRILLWIDGEPDPRVLQAGFTLLVVLDRLLRRAGGVPLGPGNWPLRGATLAILLLIVILCLPERKRTNRAITLLALADLVAVGVSSLSPEDGGVGLLVVLPALWLGSQHRIRGVYLAVAATFALVTAPALLAHGLDGEALSRLIPLPIVAGLGALAISASLDLASRARQRAEEGERSLARALRMLEAERQTSQEVFDAVNVGLMLIDADGELVGMNRRFEELVSLSFPDRSRPWPGDLFAADGRTRLLPEEVPSARAARGEEFDDLRVWAGADPRTRRALSVSARRAENEAGEFVGAALASADITELMRALEVKAEFVATVSHELRTPLTSIAGYVSILLEDDTALPAQAAAQLRVVERNTVRLTALVEALLQEAHHEDGLLRLSRTEVDLATIACASVETARPEAAARGLELTHEVGGPVLLVADGERIGQVIDNLLSNAIKYTPSGGRVNVDLRTDGAWAELRVADNGIGISAAERARLFTRFYRTRAATESAIQGVGLGLSISKTIVESHGGRIDVASEVGRGSEFVVRLPVLARGARAA